MSLRTAVVGGVLLGTLIPIAFAMFYSLNSVKQGLYKDFAAYREAMVTNVALSMAEPIYTFSPSQGSQILEVLKYDTAISRIHVQDSVNEVLFIKIDIPQRRVGTVFVNRKPITRDGEELGWVEMDFSDAEVVKDIESRTRFVAGLFGTTFLALLLVMLPLLYIKILTPLKRLHKQSRDLSANRLDTAFSWSGGDEIGELGQSLEQVRCSILDYIGELKNKNRELEQLSITDRLTGLFNRYRLDQDLQSEKRRADRFGHAFGIIMIDVDHFKAVNDDHGHQVGDVVLRRIARVLKENSRDCDIVGRWGGEEFLIICPGTSLDGLRVNAEKMRGRIAAQLFPEVGARTASFGVAAYRIGQSVDDMIARADRALYQAKEQGRDRVCG